MFSTLLRVSALTAVLAGLLIGTTALTRRCAPHPQSAINLLTADDPSYREGSLFPDDIDTD